MPMLPRAAFTRVADRTENMPPPSNDNFANRIPLTGLGITTFGYNASATSEPGEPGYPWVPIGLVELDCADVRVGGC